MHEVKLNSTLTAIDECRMEDTDEQTLTIGKDYKVSKARKDKFCITDDINEPHWFYYNDYKRFFKLKISEFRNETKEEILESLKRSEEDITNGRTTDFNEFINERKKL